MKRFCFFVDWYSRQVSAVPPPPPLPRSPILPPLVYHSPLSQPVARFHFNLHLLFSCSQRRVQTSRSDVLAGELARLNSHDSIAANVERCLCTAAVGTSSQGSDKRQLSDTNLRPLQLFLRLRNIKSSFLKRPPPLRSGGSDTGPSHDWLPPQNIPAQAANKVCPPWCAALLDRLHPSPLISSLPFYFFYLHSFDTQSC